MIKICANLDYINQNIVLFLDHNNQQDVLISEVPKLLRTAPPLAVLVIVKNNMSCTNVHTQVCTYDYTYISARTSAHTSVHRCQTMYGAATFHARR